VIARVAGQLFRRAGDRDFDDEAWSAVTVKILLVEDNKFDAQIVTRVLQDPVRVPCDLTHVKTLDSALDRLSAESWDVVVVDLSLPDASGPNAVKTISLNYDEIPIVVLSGNSDDEFATEMIRTGAQDFIVKDVRSDMSLPRVINFAVERKANEVRLRHLASYDPLTRLANRQEYCAQLEKACARADRNDTMVALVILDLDGFKAVNDLHGHQAGDALLCGVSRKLRRSIRAGDTAARLGGDEFAIILEGVHDAADVTAWASNIARDLRDSSDIDGEPQTVTASIGAALYPANGRTVDELMRCADVAMYDVKNHGRANFAFFEKDMDRCRLRRTQLKKALAPGIRNGEIKVEYQPKISLLDGSLIGLEALARWDRPGHGVIQPLEFLPIARRCGLINDIGRAVLAKVIDSQSQALADKKNTVPVSVNADAREIARASFAKEVIDALTTSQVPMHLLCIEITETTLLEPTETCLNNLRQLSEAGIQIELDDFGAGHSTLNYLRQFPLNTLKLDRSLVTDLACDAQSRLIVKTMIGLGRKLGMSIVAEGVEEQAQFAALAQIGCDAAQGFLIARAMPWQDIVDWQARGADRLTSLTSRDMTPTYRQSVPCG
jgi:diguanylate cyclase (GGDEF)-like protein